MRKKATLVTPPAEVPPQDNPEPVGRIEAASANSLSIGVMVLASLAGIYALYVGKEVVLPIVLALVLKLMLQPIVSFLCDRLRVPQDTSDHLPFRGRYGARLDNLGTRFCVDTENSRDSARPATKVGGPATTHRVPSASLQCGREDRYVARAGANLSRRGGQGRVGGRGCAGARHSDGVNAVPRNPGCAVLFARLR
jgi:hypothetical protein